MFSWLTNETNQFLIFITFLFTLIISGCFWSQTPSGKAYQQRVYDERLRKQRIHFKIWKARKGNPDVTFKEWLEL